MRNSLKERRQDNKKLDKEITSLRIVRDKLKGNIEDCVYQIVSVIIDSKGGYIYWGLLNEKNRGDLRSQMRKIIRNTLLSYDFKDAIAEDCLDELGIPKFESALYKHLLKEWYGRKVKRLMGDLQQFSIAKKESK